MSREQYQPNPEIGPESGPKEVYVIKDYNLFTPSIENPEKMEALEATLPEKIDEIAEDQNETGSFWFFFKQEIPSNLDLELENEKGERTPLIGSYFTVRNSQQFSYEIIFAFDGERENVNTKESMGKFKGAILDRLLGKTLVDYVGKIDDYKKASGVEDGQDVSGAFSLSEIELLNGCFESIQALEDDVLEKMGMRLGIRKFLYSIFGELKHKERRHGKKSPDSKSQSAHRSLPLK